MFSGNAFKLEKASLGKCQIPSAHNAVIEITESYFLTLFIYQMMIIGKRKLMNV